MSEEVLLSDDDIIVLTPQKAIAKGQIIITPVQEYKILEEVPPQIMLKMFQVANKLSTIMFDTMHCHGTNLLIQNGVTAGQINKQFSLNIIPRYENDGLKLEWKAKQLDNDKLTNAMSKFADSDKHEKEKSYLEEQKVRAQQMHDSHKKAEVVKTDRAKEKKNYLLRSLRRTP